jgi:DNA-binding response OmpR family regulator
MEKLAPLVAIVDDDKDMLEVLTHTIERYGFRAACVPNGLKLVSMLHVDKPDIILMDVWMEWIDGLHLCEALKRNENFKHIPILIMSALPTEKSKKMAAACGAADYLVKPFTSDQLIDAINKALAKE